MKCEVCNSENKVLFNKEANKKLCSRHRYTFSKYGDFRRTKYDPNEIIEYGDYAEVVLYNVKCEEVHRTIIDKDDIEKIKIYKWRYGGGYAFTSIDRKNTGMHRYIMNAPCDKVVDHINKDPLDNRKYNLRICSYQGNNRNKRVLDKNTSGITGVYYSKRDKKWIAQIKKDNIGIHLGSFEELEYAKIIRLKAEQILFKSYSPNRHLFFLLNKHEELKSIKTINELRNYLDIGNNNKSQVLSKYQVYEIKQLLSEGKFNQKQIAEVYGVSTTTIGRIKSGQVWSHIKLGKDIIDTTKIS